MVPPVSFPVPMTRLLQDSHEVHKVKHSPFVLFEERLEAFQPPCVEEFGVPVQLETKPHDGFVPSSEPLEEGHTEVGDDAQPDILRLLPHVPGQQLREIVLVPVKILFKRSV